MKSKLPTPKALKSGFVAIAGRPNTGKSTLLNRLLGTRLSIVTPKAQTTRENVLGILTDDKQGQIVFMDTPGIHKARDGGINEYMVSQAREALAAPAVIWYLVDPNSRIEHEETVLKLLAAASAPVLFILNKSDLKLSALPPTLKLIEQVHAKAIEFGINIQSEADAQPFRISAYKGRGVKELLAETWKRMPEGEFHYPDPDQLSDRPVKFFVAEKIREQLLLQLGEELPYSCAVEITTFNEGAKPPRIEATIHVERESQKGMVVGAAGKKIRDIGTAARAEIEKFMGTKVFLGLTVKLLKEWSRDAEALKRLGYHLPEKRRDNERSRSHR
jgi:GTP-binding protein Era